MNNINSRTDNFDHSDMNDDNDNDDDDDDDNHSERKYQQQHGDVIPYSIVGLYL
jgi:hypothetical protein